MSEGSDVVRPILDALAKIPGLWASRMHSGVAKVRGGWMHLAAEGTPDIIGYMPDGRFFGIECKLKGNRTQRQRAKKQDEWGQRARASQAIYIKALTVAEALTGLGVGSWAAD